MIIKTKQQNLNKNEVQSVQDATLLNLEIIAPEIIEIPNLTNSLKTLKLNTPKLNFKDFNLEGAALEILKIKGSGQTLRIDQLPHTLRMIYFEDLALDLKSSPMPNLTELTMINCQIKIFPFNQSDLISLRRLVLDHNLLTEISSDIICSTNLNHFSIDNNPLSEKFKDWLEKKFPHRF